VKNGCVALLSGVLWACVSEEPVSSGGDSVQTHARGCSNPCQSGSRGDLVSYAWMDRYTRTELEDLWADWFSSPAVAGFVADTYLLDPQYEVDAYQITYCTEDVGGVPVEATGLMALPVRKGTHGTVMYFHGTEVDRDAVPSNLDPLVTFDGITAFALVSGHAGFPMLAPDGLGFGGSTAPMQRYFDAQTEAQTAIDLREAAESIRIYRRARSEKLFSLGFSQGGHVGAAFQRELELTDSLTAAATVGAVLDVEPWFLGRTEIADNPWLRLYEGLLVVSADAAADIYASTTDAFLPPYDGLVLDLFSGDYTFDEVAAEMPANASELFQASFLDEVHDDPLSPLRLYLQDQELLSWCPQAPLALYHSEDDEEVPYTDAQTAVTALSACGAPVTLETRQGTGHLDTWHQTMPEMLDWFATF
jgi:pimeloyl-ACP methyl ester carboxylesterase